MLDVKKIQLALQDNVPEIMDIVTHVLQALTVQNHLAEIVVLLLVEYLVVQVVAVVVAADVHLQDVLHLLHGCAVVIAIQLLQAEIMLV